MVRFAAKTICGVLLFATVTATSSAADRAIVATRTIYPGQLIDTSDLKAVVLTKTPRVRYRFVSSMNEVAGLKARRTILPGRFIPVSAAQPAPLVKPGKRVRVQFQNGGLAIQLVGIALTQGSLGQEISLRNPESGKIFKGRIKARDLVVVGRL